MKRFVTFGIDQHDIDGNSLGHRYCLFEGDNMTSIRDQVFALRGPDFCTDYDEAELGFYVAKYKVTEVSQEMIDIKSLEPEPEPEPETLQVTINLSEKEIHVTDQEGENLTFVNTKYLEVTDEAVHEILKELHNPRTMVTKQMYFKDLMKQVRRKVGNKAVEDLLEKYNVNGDPKWTD